MYYLMKIDTGVNNNTDLRHPLNAVFQSNNLNEVFREINNRVLNGCPIYRLMVFQEINFDVEVKTGKVGADNGVATKNL